MFSNKAGGTSLKLPVATQVCPFGRWRNPVVEAQVMNRSWRMDFNHKITA